MFSSRPLTERNNDPAPFRCTSGFRSSSSECEFGGDHVLEKRSVGQYGKIPANPILVQLRARVNRGDDHRKLYAAWLKSMEFELAAHDDNWLSSLTDTERPHVIHAHRVLTLLATLSLSLSTR